MNNEDKEKENEPVLLKDRDWSLIDGELCLVSDFLPMAGSVVKDGKAVSPEISLPYASVALECKNHQGKIKGFITHKIDFANLWVAFKERGVNKEKEEVLVYWSAKHYKYKWYQAISNFSLTVLGSTPFPKLIVMVCPKGVYEKTLGDLRLLPQDQALVCVYALDALQQWIPDVIK